MVAIVAEHEDMPLRHGTRRELIAELFPRLTGGIQREGLTIVPLKVYFNDRGRAKAEIALARGKKQHDKRETEKERSWQREKSRLLRDKG